MLQYALEEIAEVVFVKTFNSPAVLEALSVSSPSPDLPRTIVFMDLNLSPYLGCDILRELRKAFSPEEVPVILMSGQSTEKAWNNAFASGANTFWEKPIDIEEMLFQIKNMIRFFTTRSRVSTAQIE